MLRKTTLLFLLCTLGAGLICKPLGAEPAVDERVRYYQIVGDTAQDLRRDMNAKGPGGNNDKTFDAYTAWRVTWRYRWWETRTTCRITSVTTNVRVTFTLPDWQNSAHADAYLKQQWNRYFRALYEHEKGHRDFGVQAAREIERAILDIGSRQSCAILARDANAAAEAILDRYVLLEKQYDVRTANGAETGAVFP